MNGIERRCAEQAVASDLPPVTASNLILLSNAASRQPQTTIRLCYDPAHVQHVSLIAALFSRAFVNHSADGDTSGLATVVTALPHVTFALPDSHVSLQFVPAEAGNAATPADADLSAFIDAAPRGLRITWADTLMWRLDAAGRIVERWQMPAPLTARKPTMTVLTRS